MLIDKKDIDGQHWWLLINTGVRVYVKYRIGPQILSSQSNCWYEGAQMAINHIWNWS